MFTSTLYTFYVQIGFGHLHFVCETLSWHFWTPCSLEQVVWQHVCLRARESKVNKYWITQLLVKPVVLIVVLKKIYKQLKQIIQIEHNIVKNPNWPEANHLATFKLGRGTELDTANVSLCILFALALKLLKLASFKFATPYCRDPKRTKQQPTVATLLYRVSVMLVSRKVNFFHVVSALLLKNSGLFLGWLDLL